jgi:UDP-N-acetylglucosamine acyltransferase
VLNIDITSLLDRLCSRYPSPLVDAVTTREPSRIVAYKNVTVNEEFFQGHFPGMPLMPGVLMLEAFAQVAALAVLQRDGVSATSRVYLRAVNDAKFRRQVVPGDRLRVEVSLGRSRRRLALAQGMAYVDEQVVAEAQLVLGIEPGAAHVDQTAVVYEGARLGAGTVVGPHVVIGPNVRLGANCKVGASAVIDGWTEIGDGTEVFPFASIGQIPQDLKFNGEETRLVIGRQNIFREFVTIHRGTKGGGGLTRIGDRNMFMAYAHVAHDCHVGSDIIVGHAATLGGHVTVEDFSTISAGSGVHQFCRVGQHAFIGGYSVVTLDAMPYAKTVGNRARIYGLNTIGLTRRGFSADVISKLRRAYRYLLQYNTSRAVRHIEQDSSLACKEVAYLVGFIRQSKRGPLLRRPVRRAAEEALVDE